MKALRWQADIGEPPLSGKGAAMAEDETADNPIMTGRSSA